MTDPEPRLFHADAEIVRLGEGLIACDLSKDDWTHEAHLAACAYLLTARPDIDVDREIAGLISRFNESVGGINDDHGGYHDTITCAYLAGVRAFLAQSPAGSLTETVNALLLSPAGRRDWPLRFYSRERLFSVAARRKFVPPDLAPLPGAGF
ncbi:hypothetical protein ACG3SL_06345 [Sphingomonas sp. CJ20]